MTIHEWDEFAAQINFEELFAASVREAEAMTEQDWIDFYNQQLDDIEALES